MVEAWEGEGVSGLEVGWGLDRCPVGTDGISGYEIESRGSCSAAACPVSCLSYSWHELGFRHTRPQSFSL